MHTVCTRGHYSQFLAFGWVNRPAKANDSRIMMVNSCVAFSCTNKNSGKGVYSHNIPCDKERQKLWPIALKHAEQHNLKHACVCCDHFPEEN